MIGVAILIIVLVTFAAGMLAGSIYSSSKAPLLPSEDRKELRAQRKLLNELTALAGEHIALGDDFATIALNKINDSRNELT